MVGAAAATVKQAAEEEEAEDEVVVADSHGTLALTNPAGTSKKESAAEVNKCHFAHAQARVQTVQKQGQQPPTLPPAQELADLQAELRATITSDLKAAMKETMAAGFDTLQHALGKSPPNSGDESVCLSVRQNAFSNFREHILRPLAKTCKNALCETIGAADTTCRGMRSEKKGSNYIKNEAKKKRARANQKARRLGTPKRTLKNPRVLFKSRKEKQNENSKMCLVGTALPPNRLAKTGQAFSVQQDSMTLPDNLHHANANAKANRACVEMNELNEKEHEDSLKESNEETMMNDMLSQRDREGSRRYLASCALMESNHCAASSHPCDDFQLLHHASGHRSIRTTALFMKRANVKTDKLHKGVHVKDGMRTMQHTKVKNSGGAHGEAKQGTKAYHHRGGPPIPICVHGHVRTHADKHTRQPKTFSWVLVQKNKPFQNLPCALHE